MAVRLLFILGLALSGCGLPPPAPGRVPTSAPSPALPTLTSAAPVERTIALGERHHYDLDLAAGRYVQVTVRSLDSRPAVVLTGPAGEVLAQGGATPRAGEQVLSAVVRAAGLHRLEVALADGAAGGGSYRAVLAERPAGPGDGARVAAQRLLARAFSESPFARLGFAEALRLAGEAPDHALAADALNGLGDLCFEESDYLAALPLFEQALQEARLGGAAWAEAYALNNLAAALEILNRLDEATVHSCEAIGRWQRLGANAEMGGSLVGLGNLLTKSGDAAGAAAAFGRALALFQAQGAILGQAQAWNGLGLAARQLGELDDALAAFRRALDLAQQVKSGGLEVSVLRNLAAVHRRRGELQEALRLNLAALATGHGAPRTLSKVQHDVATLYVDLGNLEQARASYEKALETLPFEQSPDAVDTLVDLGLVLERLGDPAGAVERWEQALERSRRSGYRMGEALALGYRGELRLNRGEAAAALADLVPAHDILSALDDRAQEAKVLRHLGRAHRALGDRQAAAALFDRSLALAGGDPALTALSRLERARLDRDEGRLAAARAGIEEALHDLESLRRSLGSDDLRSSFFAAKRPFYELYIDLLVRLDRFDPGQGHAGAALAASERARARGLLDLLAEGRVGVDRGLDPELKRREAEVTAELVRAQERLQEAQAAAAPNRSPNTARVAALRSALLNVEQRREGLADEIRRQNPRYAQVRYPAPLDAQAVQAQLGDDTALLEYAVGAEASYLFVVTRDGLAVHPLPPAAELETRVRELRQALQDPGRRRFGRYLQEAALLFRLLVAPAGDVLAERRRLLIAPDGPLYLLPFEALLTAPVTGRGGSSGGTYHDLPYLLRDHVVSYVPSASALAEFRAARPPGTAGSAGSDRAGPGKRFLAFADPWYGSSQAAALRAAGSPEAPPATTATRAAPLAALPGSGREVALIAGLYPPADVALYLDRAATEANVKSNPLLAGARRIHFATHGLIDEQHPLLSGLALSRSTAEDDDGMLRTAEIFGLDLSADLVVLSACETGLGKQVSGEGMVGLARAFFHAGASSLVVSLWNVAEASTPDLMLAFYRRLDPASDEADKADALRRAKLDLIAHGRFAHPFYWSPFVLVGDPR
jgi:CHAT domain-containing protein/Tfp pilus assembly protein PilF